MSRTEGSVLPSRRAPVADSHLQRDRILLFGVGRHALGNVAAHMDPSRIDCLLVADFLRPRSGQVASLLNENQSFEVVEGDMSRTVPIEGVIDLNDVVSLEAFLADPENRFVLTSVGDGQGRVADALREALRSVGRQVAAPLVVVPCENIVADSLEALSSLDLGRPVFVARTCVDRLCKSVDVKDGSVVVRTEAFHYWGIEDLANADGSLVGQGLSETLAAAGAVIEQDIEPIRFRKLALFNAVHLSIAALGRLSGYERLDLFLQEVPDGQKFLMLMMVILKRAVAHRYSGQENELARCAGENVARMMSEPDEVDRVLHRLHDGDADGFLADWVRKIEGPLREVSLHDPMARRAAAIVSEVFVRVLESYG